GTIFLKLSGNFTRTPGGRRQGRKTYCRRKNIFWARTLNIAEYTARIADAVNFACQRVSDRQSQIAEAFM
ncbi:hypothetical protein, partial [Burkholderia sola]|uniref:hypothetical protein n=1 Tax=Burkholderia sola TaxID=2843302 RepID=UPI00338D43EF